MQADGRINSEKHQVIPEWIFYIENNNKVSGGWGGGHAEPSEDNNRGSRGSKGNKANSVMSVGSPSSVAQRKERERKQHWAAKYGFKFLTCCDVAVILSKEGDSEGEWVHVPCLSLGFSEVRRKMRDFDFNLH